MEKNEARERTIRSINARLPYMSDKDLRLVLVFIRELMKYEPCGQTEEGETDEPAANENR